MAIADILRVYLEQGVELASYFSIQHSLFGFQVGPETNWEADFETLYKQGSYFVFDIFRRYLGNLQVKMEIKDSPLFSTPCQNWQSGCGNVPLISNIPYISGLAALDKRQNTLSLLIINKDPRRPAPAQISWQHLPFSPAAEMQLYQLDAADYDQFNSLDHPQRINLTTDRLAFLAENEFTFPPHSITLLRVLPADGCRLDIDCSGDLGIADLISWQEFRTKGDTRADVNQDQKNDLRDYLEVLKNWLNLAI